MNEFASLSVTDLLEPALIVVGILAIGGLLVILLESLIVYCCGIASRLASKLRKRHA